MQIDDFLAPYLSMWQVLVNDMLGSVVPGYLRLPSTIVTPYLHISVGKLSSVGVSFYQDIALEIKGELALPMRDDPRVTPLLSEIMAEPYRLPKLADIAVMVRQPIAARLLLPTEDRVVINWEQTVLLLAPRQ